MRFPLSVRCVNLGVEGLEKAFRNLVSLTLVRKIRLNSHSRIVTTFGFDVYGNLPDRTFETPAPYPGLRDRSHGRKVLVGTLQHGFG